MTLPSEPASHFYDSHGLRLHYVDWGNASAPALVLLHGGRDHCRSWDWIARALQPHFHVIAPDLRGHGDSDWATGSSYSMTDHIYDLTRMVTACGIEQMTLVGHSFGGMISLVYTGAFPEKVSRLVNLDGAFPPRAPSAPIEAQFAKWVQDIDQISAKRPRPYKTVEEAAHRMAERNTHLTAEQALHLARHAVKRTADGTFVWKFDPCQRVSAPYRLRSDDTIALWRRIACPTLFLCGESGASNPERAGILKHFRNGRQKIVKGAGHWLQHDRFDEVLSELRAFLEVER